MTDETNLANSNEEERLSETRRRQEKLSDDVDAILDRIDEVQEEAAEEFVRSYVQKGGQGWSTFVDPSFFIGAATASIVASATYDSFKKMIATVLHAINKAPGPVETNVYKPDGSLDYEIEYVLREAWDTASELFEENSARHTIDEATALHWALFIETLLSTEPLVRLDPDQFKRLRRAGAKRPEKLTPSQLVSFVVHQWFARNPNADIGLWE